MPISKQPTPGQLHLQPHISLTSLTKSSLFSISTAHHHLPVASLRISAIHSCNFGG